MFGIFRQKPKVSVQTILYSLGASAQNIVEAASCDSDLEIGLRSLATIGPIIVESKKHFGLDVKSNSIFARYLSAFEEEDFLAMAEMTRNMADTLRQAGNIQDKGALIHFWFIGDE